MVKNLKRIEMKRLGFRSRNLSFIWPRNVQSLSVRRPAPSCLSSMDSTYALKVTDVLIPTASRISWRRAIATV
jgi:hypothetical protein